MTQVQVQGRMGRKYDSEYMPRSARFGLPVGCLFEPWVAWASAQRTGPCAFGAPALSLLLNSSRTIGLHRRGRNTWHDDWLTRFVSIPDPEGYYPQPQLATLSKPRHRATVPPALMAK